MNSRPQLTLEEIRKSPKIGDRFGVSDFLSKEEMDELAKAQAKAKPRRRLFDDIDAYTAEIIACFGYEVYQMWNRGDISQNQMAKWLAAERARERGQWLPIESIVINMVGSCIKRAKGEPTPKGPKAAQKVVKSDIKTAKGEM